MRAHIYMFVAMVTLSACTNTPQKEKATSAEIILPPPPSKYGASDKQEFGAVEQKENADPNADIVMADSPVPNGPVADNAKLIATKKIIKEGDVRFETANVTETRKQLLASLKNLQGYVEDDSETTDGNENQKEFVLSIRIPANNFDSFLGTVSNTATKIDSRNIRIKDVTTQFIDIKTRLDNKKQLEMRYLDLLKRATKMTDLLAIEDKLTEIRSDIESTQSQFNYMSKQVDYSALTITFYTRQPAQVASGNGFVYKLQQALGGGWNFLQNMFFGIVAAWPIIAAALIILILVKRWRKRRAIQA